MGRKTKEYITEKQQEILDFVNEMLRDKGYPPSVREICNAVNLKSTSSVHAHLNALEKKGFLEKDGSKTRALRICVTEDESEGRINKLYDNYGVVEIPVIGKVTAGMPILATENVERNFPVPIDFIRSNNESFMLKVRGDSMVDAGILDGDYVLVSKQSAANNGDMVVALIGEEATVKTFYKENDHFRLQPENRFYQPIILRELEILGKVTGVFRKI
ncbi:MAG: transcriptional repressor LexA [Clostridiales bacterium]|jgi:repressor LexA|nr:transcriptional repressor LexA [Clostridiales bacterium]